MKRFPNWMIAAVVLNAAPGIASAQLTVVSVSPTPRTVVAERNAPIEIRFDRPVNTATVAPMQSFWAFGKWSGSAAGAITFSESDTVVTLTPDRPFSAGENVMVILSHDIEGADASALRAGGYSFQFWTKTVRNVMNFDDVQTLSTRTSPTAATQAYGGFASDLDGDGFLDLSIVNEITADVRVFLSRADNTATFDGFLTPTNAVGPRASPSETSDFNRDGHVDACVANINDNTVSILLGDGDGTFAPQQKVTVGFAPRGIAVLDVDGDGDIDIVNSNSGSNNLSLLLNNGSGVFGAATFFDGGVVNEWALAAADMNNDGMLDLVVAGNTSNVSLQRVAVNVSNGDGTFTAPSVQNSDGRSWMLVLGDVSGDGNEDVAVINSLDNRGAILFGDGAGNLAAPQRYATDPFGLASDVGDMDGDGDLDWITSSFSGDWYLHRNTGAGVFSFDRTFPAPQASSCALMFDADNDADLDLALIDEVADVVIIMQNSGFNPIPAVGGWALVVTALLLLIAATVRLRGRVERMVLS
jgi:hypothetical protein